MKNIKKLHLSKTDKKVAGVCGGIGETFEIDSTIIRLIFIFIALVTEIIPSLIIYLIAWLIIPGGVITEVQKEE